jgi:hypothetical protein
MWNTILEEDPSSAILSAWIAKEELRSVLSVHGTGRWRPAPDSASPASLPGRP